MTGALTAGAAAAIQHLPSIEALYPALVLIQVVLAGLSCRSFLHVFLGNARHHLARPGCRIKLRMSEAHQMPLLRGELPDDYPALLPAREPVE